MNIRTRLVLGSLLLTGFSGAQAQFFTTDVEVVGSLCTGNDCVNTESYGSDTLRLKENNLRIHFDDTSNTASFASRDWRILINGTQNGDPEYFAVQDATANRIPFLIEGNAPADALYVEDSGDVGLGTNAPALELHLRDGDSPALRLEQDGSSGFTPQTWDVAGNETNFFVRDVTHSSNIPFKIRPGAPDNSLYVNTNGFIGLGNASPQAHLHVRDTSGDTAMKVEEANGTTTPRDLLILENNGNPEIRLTNTANDNSWLFSAGLRFVIKNNDGEWVSRITDTGDMEITGELVTAGTTCGGGCDMVFHPDTEIESISEHAAFMWKNSYLPAVGPTVENAPINLSQKTGGMLNELEKAHIYIEQLHNRLEALEREQAELKQAVMMLTREKAGDLILTSN